MGSCGKVLQKGRSSGVVACVEYSTHKSERAISLARSRPLYSDFSEIRFGFQITTLVTLESFGTYELTLAFTSLF
jgi:hypothetical protein